MARLGDKHPRGLAREYVSLTLQTAQSSRRDKFVSSFFCLKGLRASYEILEHWDDEAYRNRMFLREENLLHGVERRAVLEYLALRTGFCVCKFESMGDGEERDPI